MPYETAAISAAVAQQVIHGRYTADPIYGDGNAGPRIAEILATKSDITIQKRIVY